MTIQFTVKQSALKALVLLSAKKDIRYYLCGVNVEFSPSITRLIVTDGHKLGVYQTGAQNGGHGSFIIPADVIAALLALALTRPPLLSVGGKYLVWIYCMVLPLL